MQFICHYIVRSTVIGIVVGTNFLTTERREIRMVDYQEIYAFKRVEGKTARKIRGV